MWYFTWVLGIGFAVLLTIVGMLWAEHDEQRRTPRSGEANRPES